MHENRTPDDDRQGRANARPNRTSGLGGPQMDHAGAAVERRRGGDSRLGHREDVGIFHRRARRRTNVMPVTVIVMVRDVLVRIRRHLVDVAGGMNGKLNARDASPRQIGGMSHAREAGKDQHQACQERQKGSHEPAPTTERFPCHCNNSRINGASRVELAEVVGLIATIETRRCAAVRPRSAIMSRCAEKTASAIVKLDSWIRRPI